jgi:hypothetical protein
VKRGRPPQRRTPLKRGAPPKRAPWVSKPNPARKKSAKRKKSVGGRARPWDPLATWCEAAIDGVCTGRAVLRHHKRGRGKPGDDDREHTLDLCDACHRWIHAHPEVSYERGWMERRTATMRTTGGTARCREADCKAPIMWVETEATATKPGRRMPIDAKPDGTALEVENGNLVLVATTGNGTPIARYVRAGSGKFRSHFASCPGAARRRRSR